MESQNKFYYLDKDYAKKGIAMVVKICEKRDSFYFNNSFICEYKGTHIPLYIIYDDNLELVRESSLIEFIELGLKKLEDNQVIINNQIVTFNKVYEYFDNNEIKVKTREMLVLEGIEKTFDNEYIKDGKLKIIPKKPKEIIKGEYDFVQEQWIEKASDEDKLEAVREQIILINSEILRIKSAGFVDIKLEKELERLKDLHYQLSYDIANKLNENF